MLGRMDVRFHNFGISTCRFGTGGAGSAVSLPFRNGNSILKKISHDGISNRSSWNTINDVSGSTTKSVYTM